MKKAADLRAVYERAREAHHDDPNDDSRAAMLEAEVAWLRAAPLLLEVPAQRDDEPFRSGMGLTVITTDGRQVRIDKTTVTSMAGALLILAIVEAPPERDVAPTGCPKCGNLLRIAGVCSFCGDTLAIEDTVAGDSRPPEPATRPARPPEVWLAPNPAGSWTRCDVGEDGAVRYVPAPARRSSDSGGEQGGG